MLQACVTWQYRVSPPGGSFRNPKKHSHRYAPPGGYIEPARRFLEIFQKQEFYKDSNDHASKLSYYS